MKTLRPIFHRLPLLVAVIFPVSAFPETTVFIHVDRTRVSKTVASYQQIRRQHIVMQEKDYSCGAASLATLMRYYFNDQVSETEILETAQDELKLAKADVAKKGLSLFDLKRLAEFRGYRAAGFKLSLKQLRQLAGPVIIFYRPNGYDHFAVLKKVVAHRVYLADPVRGNIWISEHDFIQQWGGLTLILDKNKQINAQSPLNVPAQPFNPFDKSKLLSTPMSVGVSIPK